MTKSSTIGDIRPFVKMVSNLLLLLAFQSMSRVEYISTDLTEVRNHETSRAVVVEFTREPYDSI